jgi:hypothetical protein
MSKPEMKPHLRMFTRGVGDIEGARGGLIPVPVEKVPEMIRLLIDTLPDRKKNQIFGAIGANVFEPPKEITFKCKFINRNTKLTNARIRPGGYADGGAEFIFLFYPAGLNEKTIIHEVAHIPAWHHGHDNTFKFWQRFLQEQWYGKR